MEVLSSIPVELNLETVLSKLRIRNMNREVENDIQELLDQSRSVVKPKALHEVSSVSNRDGDSLEIGGIRFTSRVLRMNLDKVETVFPYVVTCGREIDEIEIEHHDITKYYFLDQIKEMVLRLALNHLHDHLKENHTC